jgi:hypothetical protein
MACGKLIAMRTLALILTALAFLGCTRGEAPSDGGDALTDAPDAALVDAPASDAGTDVCGCVPGPHTDRIFVLSDEGALWSYDPVADAFAFVIGPVCAMTGRPFSMAVDGRGRAWILDSTSHRMQLFDVVSPGACVDSGYLPTNPDFPLFGMGFLSRDAAHACATLYVHSYSGTGPFAEGPALGSLGVVEGAPLGVRTLAAIDYDGGELAGTGDGRLFAFTGVQPSKLVEYDPDTGAAIETRPLVGLPRTNASAFAFFGGDLYLFTEALPSECDTCFASTCASAWSACQMDATCSEQIECAIERGRVTDDCGGGVGSDMLSCLGSCTDACLVSSRARVSQVARVDWDASDGPERALTILRTDAPIRIVGAGTSPCVPTGPF